MYNIIHNKDNMLDVMKTIRVPDKWEVVKDGPYHRVKYANTIFLRFIVNGLWNKNSFKIRLIQELEICGVITKRLCKLKKI